MSLAASEADIEIGSRPIGVVFFRRVEQLGERVFIKLQRRDGCTEISWKDFGALVAKTIRGLYSLGLSKGDVVGIVAENCLEWLCADLATLAAGYANVVVSPRLSDARLIKILGHSQARHAFVENKSIALRLGRLRPQLPMLEHIIVMGDSGERCAGVLSFAQLLRLGGENSSLPVHELLEPVREDDLATVIYTSGSTGEPKGVMRTHRNIIANITSGGAITLSKPEEVVALVLNLNHLLGRYGFHKSVVTGRTTALVETTELQLDLETVQGLAPTSMSLVPRVLDKICATIFAMSDLVKAWAELETLDQEKSMRGALDEPAKTRYDSLRRTLSETSSAHSEEDSSIFPMRERRCRQGSCASSS